MFFFNDTATTEIYTLSLHDALPIYVSEVMRGLVEVGLTTREACGNTVRNVMCSHFAGVCPSEAFDADRKSTRLNSSHANISYAVFCLKKKKHEIARADIISLDSLSL